MVLPGGGNVIVSKNKLKNYIFSKSHPIGRFKAKFFEKQGFTKNNLQVFVNLLRKIAKTAEVSSTIESPYGKKFIVEAEVESPKDRILRLRTVWIVGKGKKKPRFVTVYPV